MQTPNERIAVLEETVVKLRERDVAIGKACLAAVITTLDHMVDGGHLPAHVRTEAIGRIRTDLEILDFVGDHLGLFLASGLPRYPTQADLAAHKAREARFRVQDERLRKETLSVRPASPDTDQ